MQQAGFQQLLEHHRNASRTMQISGDILARGFQVAEHGDALAYTLEVVERPFNTGMVRNRQIMQDRIGRAADCHNQADGIFNAFARNDVAWLDAFFNRFDQYLRGAHGTFDFLFIGVGFGR